MCRPPVSRSLAAALVRAVAVAFSPCIIIAAPLAAAAPVDELRRGPVVELVEAVSPAVVNISAESMVRQADPFFGFFGSRPRRSQSPGSGLVIDASGVVVTNAHVIEGASRIVVTTREGREPEAEVLGADANTALAVIKA